MAQFGRAPRSGRGSRKFESCHLDQINRGWIFPPSVYFLELTDSGLRTAEASAHVRAAASFKFLQTLARTKVQNLVISTKTKRGRFILPLFVFV